MSGADGKPAAFRSLLRFCQRKAFYGERTIAWKTEGKIRSHTGGLHFRKSRNAPQHVLEELFLALRLTVRKAVKGNRSRQQMMRVKSHACTYFFQEAFDKQPSANQQKQRQGQLPDDQQALQTEPLGTRGRAAAALR